MRRHWQDTTTADHSYDKLFQPDLDIRPVNSLLQLRGAPLVVSGLPTFAKPDSQLVTASQFYEPAFAPWLEYYLGKILLDRKIWEYCYILNAIELYMGMKPGRRGLCFGAGKEFLPAIMAQRGCEVLATDYMPAEGASLGWETQSREDFYYPDFVSRAAFEQNIRFQAADMNHLSPELRRGGFDYLWTTGSIEHIGGHRNGLAFVEAAMDCLRPGGIAVHTTEFTLTSESYGHDTPELSFYCKKDILALAQRLTARGHQIVLNFDRGTTPADTHVDTPPFHYGMTLLAHFKSHVITSIGLIIQKSMN